MDAPQHPGVAEGLAPGGTVRTAGFGWDWWGAQAGGQRDMWAGGHTGSWMGSVTVQLLKSADLGRQSLLYLKEIGHGWFGKVSPGTPGHPTYRAPAVPGGFGVCMEG